MKYPLAALAIAFASPSFAQCAAGFTQVPNVFTCQKNTQPPPPPPPPPPPVACTSSSATAGQMGVISPCSPTIVTANEITTPALSGIAIADANAAVAAGTIPVAVQAVGLVNVEVWTHGKMASRLTDSGGGEFIGTLDLSKEPAGPLKTMFMAWDSTPGTAAKVQLQGAYTLFVGGTRPAIPTPAPAAGMTLAFSDHFTSLNATPCKLGTGTWPKCTKPTATDGFVWYENLYNGQDFGDCANEHTDGPHNPFTILSTGGLRIRNQYDPAYVDPYGFGRHQYCGVLSSGFPDGTTSMPATDGYYEARVLVPNSACGASGNNTCSGGTWPSFWMLATNGNATNGWIELDEMEEYGSNPGYFQGYTHAYAPAIYPPGSGNPYAGNPDGDLTTDWHTVGMLVKGSGTATGTVCNYLDEKLLACSPMPTFAVPNSGVKPTWSIMAELASGGGWVENPPPAGYYDYYIDYIAVWH